MEDSNQALAATLHDIRERIEKFRRRRGRIGEQNTKAILIDPLLSALGWDLFEVDEVIREYRHKAPDNPVDYALFILRSPCLFVEAKDLGTDLGDRRWVSQVLGYATVVGVEWCVLTNGDEYRLYNAHAPVGVEEKLFRAVRISDLSQEEYTANTLSLLSRDKMGEKLIDVLWKAEFIDRHVKVALEDLLAGENHNLVNWIRRNRPELARAEIRESLKRADIHIDFPAVRPATSLSREEAPRRKMKATTPGPRKDKTKKRKSPRTYAVKVSDLIGAGLINPPLELEREYRDTHLRATIQSNGRVTFDGQLCNSLSLAAAMARKSVIGAPPGRKYPQTNGWTFWKYRDRATGTLKEVDAIRQEYLKRKARQEI